jgi:hypothetical protein
VLILATFVCYRRDAEAYCMPRVVQFAVLVVDDEDGLRQPLTRQLGQVEGCGCAVLSAPVTSF